MRVLPSLPHPCLLSIPGSPAAHLQLCLLQSRWPARQPWRTGPKTSPRLALICGTPQPPTHICPWRNIKYSLSPTASERIGQTQCSSSFPSPPGHRAAGRASSLILGSQRMGQTPALSASLGWRTQIKPPTGLIGNPLASWYSVHPPVGRGLEWGSHHGFLQSSPPSDLVLDSHWARGRVMPGVISFLHIFEGRLFYNSLWYLMLLVSCVIAKTSSVAS